MTILQTKNTVKFDPANAEHRDAYAQFIMTGKWGLRFELEHPFTSIPALAMFRLANFACTGSKIVIEEEKILNKV